MVKKRYSKCKILAAIFISFILISTYYQTAFAASVAVNFQVFMNIQTFEPILINQISDDALYSFAINICESDMEHNLKPNLVYNKVFSYNGAVLKSMLNDTYYHLETVPSQTFTADVPADGLAYYTIFSTVNIKGGSPETDSVNDWFTYPFYICIDSSGTINYIRTEETGYSPTHDIVQAISQSKGAAVTPPAIPTVTPSWESPAYSAPESVITASPKAELTTTPTPTPGGLTVKKTADTSDMDTDNNVTYTITIKNGLARREPPLQRNIKITDTMFAQGYKWFISVDNGEPIKLKRSDFTGNSLYLNDILGEDFVLQPEHRVTITYDVFFIIESERTVPISSSVHYEAYSDSGELISADDDVTIYLSKNLW
ncbi:MAG: hypothetical protein LBQ68_01260 [Clostridiales bacterium]|nr:hypothetical protein [Clostridiales bacterium]